jgi:hypothetical protein
MGTGPRPTGWDKGSCPMSRILVDSRVLLR